MAHWTPATPAAAASAASVRSASTAQSRRNVSGVAVAMAGSAVNVRNVGVAMTRVTRAPIGRARSMPGPTAMADNLDPSVGRRMCLYIVRSPRVRWIHQSCHPAALERAMRLPGLDEREFHDLSAPPEGDVALARQWGIG